MRLNTGRIFLLGIGFLAVSFLWSVYNSFVPIFLKERFALSATVVGFLMTLDNIAALFIQPYVGALSDRTRTRIGRRMPYILAAAPVAAVAFAFIPPARTLPWILAAMIGTLLAMKVMRTPVIALMPDIVPSPLRSKANGIINFMGGVGALLAFFLGAKLYDLSPNYPFWLGSLLLVLAALGLFLFIQEPKEAFEPATNPEELAFLHNLRQVFTDPDRSALFLFLAIFFWFVGFNAIEAFFTSYGKYTLGISESSAALLLGFFSLTFIAASIPAGWLGETWGRRRTILTGLILLTLLLIPLFFLRNVGLIRILLLVGGVAWAFVNINSLPMVVDIPPQDRLGTYTGLYYLFSTVAAILGPWLAGGFIDLAGGEAYHLLFVLAPLSLLAAALCMLGVHKGEART